MRVLIISCLLSFSSIVSACDQPISISYAPFVSLLVVDRFFGGFHRELEALTGCKVTYQIHRDFEHFLQALFLREHTLAITPGNYFKVLKPLNYEVVSTLTSERNRNFYVIANSKSMISNLNELVGKKAFIVSPLSGSGSHFLAKLNELGLTNKVDIEYINSYDAMILAIIKGEGAAAVIVDEYWGVLDRHVREKSLKIIAQIETNTSTDFVILKEHAALAPQVRSSLQASELVWGEPNNQANGPELLESLLQSRFEVFKNKQGQ